MKLAIFFLSILSFTLLNASYLEEHKDSKSLKFYGILLDKEFQNFIEKRVNWIKKGKIYKFNTELQAYFDKQEPQRKEHKSFFKLAAGSLLIGLGLTCISKIRNNFRVNQNQNKNKNNKNNNKLEEKDKIKLTLSSLSVALGSWFVCTGFNFLEIEKPDAWEFNQQANASLESLSKMAEFV